MNATESGDSSASGDSPVVTRWTVDQDVVCSNPTHCRNLKLLSCARFPGYSAIFGKMRTDFRWPLSYTESGLKIRVYILRLLTVVSDCTGARIENDTRPARNKQCTHRHRIYPSHRTTNLLLYGLCTPSMVCCEKQQKSFVITLVRIRQVLTPQEMEQLPTSLSDRHRLTD